METAFEVIASQFSYRAAQLFDALHVLEWLAKSPEFIVAQEATAHTDYWANSNRVGVTIYGAPRPGMLHPRPEPRASIAGTPRPQGLPLADTHTIAATYWRYIEPSNDPAAAEDQVLYHEERDRSTMLLRQMTNIWDREPKFDRSVSPAPTISQRLADPVARAQLTLPAQTIIAKLQTQKETSARYFSNGLILIVTIGTNSIVSIEEEADEAHPRSVVLGVVVAPPDQPLLVLGPRTDHFPFTVIQAALESVASRARM